jgi:hypothetical protein
MCAVFLLYYELTHTSLTDTTQQTQQLKKSLQINQAWHVLNPSRSYSGQF